MPNVEMFDQEEEMIDDAEVIEGVETAKQEVASFLKKLAKSPEFESEMKVHLYQWGNIQNQAEVATIEMVPGDNPDSLAEEIVDLAVEDARTIGKGKKTYVVKVDGYKGRLNFKLKVTPSEPDDIDDMEDVPTRKGMIAQQMRHNEKTEREKNQLFRYVVDKMDAHARKQDDRIEKMERHQLNYLKAYEELISTRHMRDMELRREERAEKRSEQLSQMLMLVTPLLLQKFLPGASAMLPAVLPQQAPEASQDIPVADLKQLIRGMTPEQLGKLKEVLTPEQLLNVINVATWVTKEDEAEGEKNSENVGNRPQM